MKVVIIGSGGLAREFCAWFESTIEVCGFSTKEADEFYTFALPGKCFTPDITPEMTGTANAVMAVGTPALKEKMYHFYTQRGFRFPSFVHATSFVASSARLHEGCVVTPQVVIGSDSVLGKCTYINLAATIAHDVCIADFCQINPGARINGAITIGLRCMIGSNTAMLQGVSIADDVTTAVGAVIFSSVLKACTVIGNPARTLHMPAKSNVSKE